MICLIALYFLLMYWSAISLFSYTRKISLFKTVVEAFKYVIFKKVSIYLNNVLRFSVETLFELSVYIFFLESYPLNFWLDELKEISSDVVALRRTLQLLVNNLHVTTYVKTSKKFH